MVLCIKEEVVQQVYTVSNFYENSVWMYLFRERATQVNHNCFYEGTKLKLDN